MSAIMELKLKRSRSMTVSAAKLEANRRNALKSCGPRTEAGKNRSKLNAVTHGMRAETLVLVDEDPQALEDRRAAWTASLLPSDDVERRIVEDAVVSTWQQDRARRAQIARLNLNILNHGVDQTQTNEEEVQELGRRLFVDRLGPLPFYPTGCDYDDTDDVRFKTTSFDDEEDDLDRPGLLVLRLQATLLGCEWLLGQWAALKAILDRGQPWLSSDKLKAVRLLGKQPFDVIDDRDVALVFLASFVLKGDSGQWCSEIFTEMNRADIKRFVQNAADRQLGSLKPENATKAREALLGIIERATERLNSKADNHRVRAELEATLAGDLLAFDDSPAGERLRRYELAHGRSVARALDSLHKHRRATNTIDSGVTTGTVAAIDILQRVQPIMEEDATNEPTVPCENTTNEPTAARENVTNEPTLAAAVGLESSTYMKTKPQNTTNEPTDARKFATNEPTATCENVTNESTVDSEIVTNEPTVAADVGLTSASSVEPESPTYMNAKNTTNEPTLAGDTWHGESVELRALIDGEHFLCEIDIEKASEELRQEVERRKAIRLDMLRRLNKAIRTEACAAREGRLDRSGSIGKSHSEATTRAAVGS
jgi:hypothetical protein